VFVLRVAFEPPYDDIAETVGSSAAACRQIFHRAQIRTGSLRATRPAGRRIHQIFSVLNPAKLSRIGTGHVGRAQ
jgi:hypothetical protein